MSNRCALVVCVVASFCCIGACGKSRTRDPGATADGRTEDAGPFGSGATGGGSPDEGGGGDSGGGGGGTSGGEPASDARRGTCGGETCAANEECCLQTGKCFDPESRVDACAPDPDPPGDPEHAPCASNLDCGPNAACFREARGDVCTGSGRCYPRTDCGSCSGDCEVCGCNGITYPSIQVACTAGVRVSGMGSCGETIATGWGGQFGIEDALLITRCGDDAHCGDGEACCAVTGECYPSASPYLCGPPPEGSYRRCLDDSDCSPGDLCSRPDGGCSGEGGCVSTGGDCPGLLVPVCGCDGNSYTNPECARAAGVNVAHEGECEP